MPRHLNFVLAVLFLAMPVQAATAWNEERISWLSMQEALSQAEASGQTIMLVLHSEGCGACQQYSELFQTESVVKASKALLMVIIDDGEDEALSERYSLDGSYVPRTYFINASGDTLDIRIGKPEARFQYYYGSRDPAALVAKMRMAAGH